jgi:ABC-type transport system substrate-binding protein
MIDFLTTSILTVDTYKKYGIKKSSDYMTQFYDCLVPNTASGFFSDINMRRALAYALEKREIVSKALLGHAVATDYPVAPDSYLSGGSSDIYEYNPQKAMTLLEQAGWKDRNKDGVLERVDGTQITDINIKLLIPLNKEDTYRRDVAENIRTQLMQCGIRIDVVEEPYDTYRQSLESGNFELALCSFYVDHNPDVSFMAATGGAANYGRYSDERIDAVLKKCKTAVTESDMKNAYYEMESLFMELLPQISLYFKTNALLYDASINISGSMRDMNIYTTIPKWYLYVKETELQ